jgi:hypothetical protein
VACALADDGPDDAALHEDLGCLLLEAGLFGEFGDRECVRVEAVDGGADLGELDEDRREEPLPAEATDPLSLPSRMSLTISVCWRLVREEASGMVVGSPPMRRTVVAPARSLARKASSAAGANLARRTPAPTALASVAVECTRVSATVSPSTSSPSCKGKFALMKSRTVVRSASKAWSFGRSWKKPQRNGWSGGSGEAEIDASPTR